MHRSKTHSLILLLFAGFLRHVSAQDTLSFSVIENSTYSLYQNKKWKELEMLCNKAIGNNFDYYYLRVRAGIAAFEQKKYRSAISQFKKALVFNSNDNLVFEYLYFCYLYSNREEEARKLSRSFSKEFASYMKTDKLSSVSFLSFEGGAKLSDSVNLFKPAFFGQLGINHFVNNKFSLYHAFTFYSQNESRFNVNQFEYYLKSTIALKKNLSFSAGIHSFYYNSNINVRSVTTYTVPDPYRPNVIHTNTSVATAINNEKSLGILGAATITKHSSLTDLSLGVATLLSDTAKQLMASVGLLFYPFKNNNLIIGTQAYVHSEDYLNTFNFAFAPCAMFKLGKRLFVNLNYLKNNGANISEYTGSFINNSYDYTLSRLCIMPSYYFSPTFSLYGTFGFEEKKEKETSYLYHYSIFSIGVRLNPFNNTH